MRKFKLNEMSRGWFVGDFAPSAYKTRECEVAVKSYKKGDSEARHYHKIALELTAIISGRVMMNGVEFSAGDIVEVAPFESVEFRALEACVSVVVKIPSAKDDKFLGFSESELRRGFDKDLGRNNFSKTKFNETERKFDDNLQNSPKNSQILKENSVNFSKNLQNLNENSQTTNKNSQKQANLTQNQKIANNEFSQSPKLQALQAPKAPLNIVIPMAGAGSRFAKAGFTKPKPFIEVAAFGTKMAMIEWVLRNLKCENATFTLIAQRAHLSQERAFAEFLKSHYKAQIIPINELTQGTACTLLAAENLIDTPAPLLVANSDQLVDFALQDFVKDCFERGLDGSILCFDEPGRDPKWSFVRVDGDGLVCEVREKQPISTLASVGIYLFARGADFVRGAKAMIAANRRVNDEFYTAPVYNELIKKGAKIGVFIIAKSAMHGLGTPQDLEIFENKFKDSKREF